MHKPKLLFLTPELPYPPHSGGKLKSLKLLDSLAERYDITLLSPLKVADAQHQAEFEALSPCTQHLHRAVDVPRSAGNLLRSYLVGQPLNVLRSYHPQLAREVKRLAGKHDVIFVDHFEVAAYLPRKCDATIVYHAHNAYHVLWQRYAEVSGNPLMRLAAGAESRRVRRAELKIAKRADLVLAAPNDAKLLIQGGVDPRRVTHTFHLGDDRHLSRPELHFAATKKRLMYVGLLGWEANVQGLLWFVDEVWPQLVHMHPDLEFHIVGKNPDERLQRAVAPYPGIRLCGFLPDLEDAYQEARVSVAPLLFGSGMKVKVLDAMARGLPTVTTTVGAEGIDYRNKLHLSVADDPQAMAMQIVALLEEPRRWNRQRLASRQLIRERYTWDRLFRDMHQAMDEAQQPQELRRRNELQELLGHI